MLSDSHREPDVRRWHRLRRCSALRCTHGREAAPMPRSSRALHARCFMRFPNDGKRHEIIERRALRARRPTCGIRSRAAGCLRSAFPVATAPWLVFYGPFGHVILSNHDVVEPDLLAHRRGPTRHPDAEECSGRAGDRGRGSLTWHAKGRQDQEASPLRARRRARILARRSRARSHQGVSTRGPTNPSPEAIELTGDDVLQTPILPGLAVALADLFAPT